MVNPLIKKYFEPYDETACQECGECLQQCPVMNLSKQEAVNEIKRLKNFDPKSISLKKCETCFACNLVCLNHANPAQLILQNFYQYQKENDPRKWGRYFQPYEDNNFRHTIEQNLSQSSREMLQSWKKMERCEEFWYPGCNICNTPYIVDSEIFRNCDFRGGIDYCCGEMLYRTGQLDRLKDNTERLNQWIKKLGAKKMVITCTAGYTIFNYVLPQYGFDSSIEIVSYLPWVFDKLMNGEWSITHPIHKKVTIQESCYSKLLGPTYYSLPRKILQIIGCEVIEEKHCKEKAFCCGIGGGFPVKSSYHPLKLIKSSFRAINEGKISGADMIVSYCSGCLLTMNSMGYIHPSKIKIYHLIELVRMAIGEEFNREIASISKSLWKGAVKSTAPYFFIPSRFQLKKIEKDPD